MYDQAPGNILQIMYFKHRIAKWNSPGMRFIELGSGNGAISRILLQAGMQGIGMDLNDDACEINRTRNQDFIVQGQYRVLNDDFLKLSGAQADLILSSHVIEHLPDEVLNDYFAKCKSILNPGGRVVSLVPANQKYWCVEDETAGHYRRFEHEDFRRISEDHGYEVQEIVGLTYPLSNMLFSLGNRLIEKTDGWKRGMTPEEQTLISSTGVKQIMYKTVFPDYFRYLVNEVTMFPFHLLQLLFRQRSLDRRQRRSESNSLHCQALWRGSGRNHVDRRRRESSPSSVLSFTCRHRQGSGEFR